MKENDLIELDIIDVSEEGAGIGRTPEGIVVFVKGALPGDRVQARVTRVKKRFAQAECSLILEKSKDRGEAFCKWQGLCGGCGLGKLDYHAQLKVKEKHVRDKLERIAGVPGDVLKGITGGEGTLRNKAVMAVGYDEKGDPAVGFRPRGSNVVTDCDECALQAPTAMAIAEAMREYIKKTGVSLYDGKTGEGLIRHLVVKTAFGTGEVMAVIVVNGDKIPDYEILVNLMDEYVNRLGDPINGWNDPDTPSENEGGEGSSRYSLESVVLNVNTRRKGEILGEKCITLAGKSAIDDELMGLRFQVSPLSFYQVNPVQAEKLYNRALEYALEGDGADSLLADLYCGVGTMGLIAAARGAREVLGIESVRDAVLDANRNAVINGIVNIRFITGKAEEIFQNLEDFRANVVILDPPRRGCDEKLLEAIGKVMPERIVYVSCDPGTLCRDMKLLMEKGYEIREVKAFDMFPNTLEVECCAFLVRGGGLPGLVAES